MGGCPIILVLPFQLTLSDASHGEIGVRLVVSLLAHVQETLVDAILVSCARLWRENSPESQCFICCTGTYHGSIRALCQVEHS